MTGSERHLTLTALTWVAPGVMILIVAVSEFYLARAYDGLTTAIPAFDYERAPLLALGYAFGICIQALLVVTGVLVGYILADRIFHPVALRLVDALVGTLVVATLLVFGTFFHMPAPPLAAIALAGTAFGVTVVLVVLVLRALLHRSASMHTELEEVV